jgi:enoyl-CoA hydratase
MARKATPALAVHGQQGNGEEMAYENYECILFDKKDKVLTATLNRPQSRNAVNPVLDRELVRLFREVDDDQTINVLVLTGAGKAFCAGGDIPDMLKGLEDMSMFENGYKNGKRILQSMLDCEKPIICRMNGDAVGLGATLALFCDIVIAADTARIADPHVRIGLVAGDGGAVIWPQLVGYARAKQYLLGGDFLSATEAERIGLVNFAVPPEALDAKVDEWSSKLATGAQKAIRWTKATLNIGLRQMLASMVDAGFALETVSSRSRDHAEAVDAFVARRKPNFTGE